MSNTMNVPAHIAARIAARKAGEAAFSAIAAALSYTPAPPKISTRASRFRLVEGGVETVVGTELDVIIVGANPAVSKVFYEGQFDPNAGDNRPRCFSNDGKHPDQSVTDPVAESCATCPNNVLGSKTTFSGAKSKLCSDVRYLAVVPAADPKKVYSLNVPVSGMRGLREYIQDLNNYGVMPEEVVTKLCFDDNESYPKLVFKRGGAADGTGFFLGANALEHMDALMRTEEVATATRQPHDNLLAAPSTAPQKKIDAPKKNSETENKTSETEPAPKKKATAKKKEVVEEVDDAEEDGDQDEIEDALDALFD